MAVVACLAPASLYAHSMYTYVFRSTTIVEATQLLLLLLLIHMDIGLGCVGTSRLNLLIPNEQLTALDMLQVNA